MGKKGHATTGGLLLPCAPVMGREQQDKQPKG
jgi:hypothetical protein